MEQYEMIEKIDQGKNCEVFKGNNLLTGQYVAMKKLRKEQRGGDFPSKATREINILGALDHKNIIKLLDVVPTEKSVYLILEYRGMDLSMYLASCSQLFPHIEPHLIKILDSISYCHSKRIMHRDLKPKNILIKLSSKTLKLADFGIATWLENSYQPLTQEVLTQWYRAPEILLGSTKYTTAVDVWSAGCIFAEIVTAEILFMGNSEIDQLIKIFSLFGTPSKKTWAGFDSLPGSRIPFIDFPPKSLKAALNYRIDRDGVRLLMRMLCLDSECRITAINALQHDYFGVPDSSSSSSLRGRGMSTLVAMVSP